MTMNRSCEINETMKINSTELKSKIRISNIHSIRNKTNSYKIYILPIAYRFGKKATRDFCSLKSK